MSPVASLKIEDIQFDYIRFGSGAKLLIAFPGYGDRMEQFLKIETALSHRYTVYVVELPGHGENDWSRNQFYKSDFKQLISAIQEKENKATCSLMGHSFGGRVILSLLSGLGESIDEIYLLAPDGLDREYIKRATMLPLTVRKLLQRFLKNPGWYLGLVSGLNKLGLLKDYSFRFVQLNFANERRRKRLFLSWNSIDDFTLNHREIKSLIRRYEIPIKLILGKKDLVIPGDAWKKWAKDFTQVELHVIDTDHRMLGEELAIFLKTNKKEE